MCILSLCDKPASQPDKEWAGTYMIRYPWCTCELTSRYMCKQTCTQYWWLLARNCLSEARSEARSEEPSWLCCSRTTIFIISQHSDSCMAVLWANSFCAGLQHFMCLYGVMLLECYKLASCCRSLSSPRTTAAAAATTSTASVAACSLPWVACSNEWPTRSQQVANCCLQHL